MASVVVALRAVRPALVNNACATQYVISTRGFAAAKGKKAAKKGAKKGGEDANFELMLRNVKGRYPEAEPWSEEDKARFQEIGRRFNVLSTIEHNHFMRDIQTKIDLKWEAINALPPHLQQEALELDLSPVPEERGFATWTPPIEGFRRYTDEDTE
ncbi:hypothetical protein FI667_g6965, partial [Globisporangium splendens]